MNETPTAEQVRMVCVSWRGRSEVMTLEEASELRGAIGRAIGVPQSTTHHIIWTVCDHFNLPVKRVMSDRRDASTALARQTAMYFMREMTGLSLDAIGHLFPKENGKPRDHGTVLHACQKLRKLGADNKDVAAHLVSIQVVLTKST